MQSRAEARRRPASSFVWPVGPFRHTLANVRLGLSPRRSPTLGLLLGLFITLGAVVANSGYITWQMSNLRTIESDLADRNRKDSLQLLRVQNNLNLLGLAMRDMLDGTQPYPLTAWSAQFDRIRLDLEDALRREDQLAIVRQTPEQRRYLEQSLAQFWDAGARTFELARNHQEDEARAQIRVSLLARQQALTTAVARLLVANNEREEQTTQRVVEIYSRVQGQVYWFIAATLVTILVTGVYVSRSNRRLFAELGSLSEQRRELAQTLIATRESSLRQIARDLHDEFGQILTAMGSMLTRAGAHAPEQSPLRAELREICEMAQMALDKVRDLSQTLHPAILDEAGLEGTLDWYLSTVERQLGVTVSYARSGTPAPVDATTSIHLYRVLQEALSNVARHSGADRAWVRLEFRGDALQLEVEDHGQGLDGRAQRRGLGMVTMRERAGLLGGSLEFLRPSDGGTIVRLRVPLDPPDVHGD